jgi:hypothetical protein
MGMDDRLFILRPLSRADPADAPRRDDEIDLTAAALGAGEPACPIGHREIGAVPRSLLAGVGVDLVLTDGAPDALNVSKVAAVALYELVREPEQN